jgi:hypothetical protein
VHEARFASIVDMAGDIGLIGLAVMGMLMQILAISTYFLSV